jgi:hypothetical protein
MQYRRVVVIKLPMDHPLEVNDLLPMLFYVANPVIMNSSWSVTTGLHTRTCIINAT